jgi:hypothetical protein
MCSLYTYMRFKLHIFPKLGNISDNFCDPRLQATIAARRVIPVSKDSGLSSPYVATDDRLRDRVR